MYNFASKVCTSCYISRLLQKFFFSIMKKYLLLVVVAIITQLGALNAQTLFTAPDTVCVRQPIHLNSTIFGASNYYWSFCSGDMINPPTGINMGNGFGFDIPANIEIVKDVTGFYYAFVVNSNRDELLRLNFGRSLSNIPTVTNFGNLTNGLPHHPTSLYVSFDSSDMKWFVFVSGGYHAAESNLARVDFGTTLSNPRPNIATFGNLGGVLNGPKGIFVAKDADRKWYGYLVNRYNNRLVKLDFGYNISNTPIYSDMGNIGGRLNLPTDVAGIYDNNEWYLFVANRGNNTIARIELGVTLNATAPSSTNLGDFNFRVLEPSSISLTRDCGQLVAYITDSSTSQVVKISSASAMGTFTPVTYSIIGATNFPSSISSFLRDGDDIYAFITNAKDSTMTRLTINHCTDATIPSFTESTPPSYFYTNPGLYNVYYVVNQGLPTMQTECKQIRVLPVPNIFMNQDTVICKGDTIQLHAISNYADSFVWGPIYNIDTVYNHTDTVKVWPRYSFDYNVWIRYPNGCIVDTVIRVKVIKVVADAGQDRSILDGASTLLGGPNTNLDGIVSYAWSPSTYLNSTTRPFVTANPPADMTYALEVTLTEGAVSCKATDTVIVRLNCGDFYLPNAFIPTSTNPKTNTFGIQNASISQLNYFRIFDRWGNLVFETTNPAYKWDGNFSGSACPVGVYTWIADGFCTGGKPIRKYGNVSLLR